MRFLFITLSFCTTFILFACNRFSKKTPLVQNNYNTETKFTKRQRPIYNKIILNRIQDEDGKNISSNTYRIINEDKSQKDDIIYLENKIKKIERGEIKLSKQNPSSISIVDETKPTDIQTKPESSEKIDSKPIENNDKTDVSVLNKSPSANNSSTNDNKEQPSKSSDSASKEKNIDNYEAESEDDKAITQTIISSRNDSQVETKPNNNDGLDYVIKPKNIFSDTDNKKNNKPTSQTENNIKNPSKDGSKENLTGNNQSNLSSLKLSKLDDENDLSGIIAKRVMKANTKKNNNTVKSIENEKIDELKNKTSFKILLKDDIENTYSVQVGAYESQDEVIQNGNAISKVVPIFIQPVVVNDKDYYRIKTGPFNTKKEADNNLYKLIKNGYYDVFVVAN